MLLAFNQISPFVEDLGIVLGVAALTSVLCRKLGLSSVLGYLVAGLLVGPYLPLPLFADPVRIQSLSEFGVVLVMFGIGLEFSSRRLVAVIPQAGLVGLIQVSAMLSAGFLAGRWFGWSPVGSVILGAVVAISSTMVVAKAFDEHPTEAGLSELVYGVLIIQDLAAVVLIAVVMTVASGTGLELGELAGVVGQLFAFMLVLVVGGLLLVPRVTRFVARMAHPETTVVFAVGLCFVLALLSAYAGYPVALGAFVAGSLVADSGEGKGVEQLVGPIRDLFAAVFFVSIGMMINPNEVLDVLPTALGLALVVILGQFAVVTIASFFAGHGLRRSMGAGLCLGQIGEFSFIIAQIGANAGVVSSEVIPMVVVVAIITSITTPIAVARADRIAGAIDNLLPQRLHTVAAVYQSWIAAVRDSSGDRERSRVRVMIRRAVLDAAMIVLIIIGRSLTQPWLVTRGGEFGLEPKQVVIASGVLALFACGPFALGMTRSVRALGTMLARATLPSADPNRTDLAAAPRTALLVGIQLAALLALTLPMLALTQPFLPTWFGAPLLGLLLGVVAFSFWRRADDLDGHVRAGAGAEAVLELLKRSAGSGEAFAADQAAALLPGLGEITPFVMTPGLPTIGHSLAEVDLRGRCGATVIAIERPGAGRTVPNGSERFQEGDVLALAGTHEAIEEATAVLLGRGAIATIGSAGAARPAERDQSA